MASPTWMIYGATGYTGELVAREAGRRGLKPILAARRAEPTEALAAELGLEARVFALDDATKVEEGLSGIDAVLHCAGPFQDTSASMVAGCLATKTHYLDITGEIAVFEACRRKSDAAKAAGCVLLPGVGFDVVPTDCLAATLADRLPGAESLELAFAGAEKPSRGTAKTAARGIAEGGAIRKDGRITKVPTAWKTRSVAFADKERTTVSIPWGDVSTAYYSTDIGNIVVYMAMPPKLIKRIRLFKPFLRLAANSWVQSIIAKRIDKNVTGPTEAERETNLSQLWGRVEKGDESAEATLTCAESYKLTVLTSIEATLRVARGDVEPGTTTPSKAFGADFIEQFEGSVLTVSQTDAR